VPSNLDAKLRERADQRETPYQLLAQATTSHVIHCAAAAAGAAPADGC
jgi:hypothetical protein